MLKTAVATSILKDSYKAGKEVSEKILKKLGKKPDFILLFSTLHYGKNKKSDKEGFRNLLDGAYSILPEETKLVGGTVPGFINNDGCYVRGVTGFAVSYQNMNVTIAYGKNTKRNPKKAAKNAVDIIKRNLKNTTTSET